MAQPWQPLLPLHARESQRARRGVRLVDAALRTSPPPHLVATAVREEPPAVAATAASQKSHRKGLAKVAEAARSSWCTSSVAARRFWSPHASSEEFYGWCTAFARYPDATRREKLHELRLLLTKLMSAHLSRKYVFPGVPAAFAPLPQQRLMRGCCVRGGCCCWRLPSNPVELVFSTPRLHFVALRAARGVVP